MAEVFEAEHETFDDRKVAIKILDPILTRKEKIAKRFVNEAKIMARLEHQNIVKVVDFEKRTNMLAIVMELLEGKSLTGYIKQKGKLKKNEAIKIFKQTLNAFEFAHNKGVVHRDVKPSNIFIETGKNNNVKILDFGIAKLLDSNDNDTNTGAQMGTPIYMSPEQVKDSKNIDKRSDIYSLGVVLYYVLKGKPAYDSKSLSNFAIYTKIVNEPMPELTEHTQLNKIIKKATAKNPKDRYQTCKEFEKAFTSDRKTLSNKNSNNEDETIIYNKHKKFVKEEQDEDETMIDDPETELWDKIKNKTDIQQFEKYLQKYKNGKYKQQASKKIEQLKNARVESSKTDSSNKGKKNKILISIIALIVVIIILFIWQPWEINSMLLIPIIAVIIIIILFIWQQWAKITEKVKEEVVEDNLIAEAKITEKVKEEVIEEITKTVKALDFDFVSVKGGTFQMGSNDYSDEKPIHSVTLSSFNIGKYQVTQAQWKAVMGNNPSYFKGDKRPVEKVSWNDIQKFLQKLNKMTGHNYRLPTEAEWEYAAKGGENYKYSGSNNIDDVAWYDKNSGSGTHPVGQKSPNGYGLYDMSGNVWEWCQDVYKSDFYSQSENSTNPIYAGSGSLRVIRGGSWDCYSEGCRSANRDGYTPSDSDYDVGFRLAETN